MKKVIKTSMLINEFKKFINASASGRRKKPDGTKICSGTLDSYRNCLKLIELFTAKNGEIVLMKQITLNMLQFQSRRRYWQRQWNLFRNMLQQKGLCDSTIKNNTKILRAFLKYQFDQYGCQDAKIASSFLSSGYDLSNFITLSAEQLGFLVYNKLFYNRLTARLRPACDIMVIGCTTALRFSDLMALRTSNLKKIDGREFLIVRSKKTGTECKILLPEYGTEILKNYKSKLQGRLLPKISNGNMNILLKQLGKEAGWNWSCIRQRSKKGKMVPDKQGKTRFYELLTTHTMRRTAITLMLQAGVPDHIVRQISGHAPGSKEFFRYVNITEDWMRQEVENAFNAIRKFQV